MEDKQSPQEVSIIDKDESTDRAVSIVGGFVIEESNTPFPNGKLSFIPEEYGKRDGTPQSLTRTRPKTPASSKDDGSSLPPGMVKCEFCGMVGEREMFLAPSRRFCNVSCCKRFSAEKRYYPYGRDEEGVAMSIKQGLVNRHRSLRTNAKAQQSTREDRRRRLAYYSAATAGGSEGAPPTGRGRRGRRSGPASLPNLSRTSSSDKASHTFVEPYSHPHGTPVHRWTVDDVTDFLTHLGYEAYVDKFTEHEIDGKALCLVRDHHLLMTLKLRLGPTLKIIEHVSVLKSMEGMDE